MKKPVYVGMSKLDISKKLKYKFWYEYIKPKYGDRVKLCYTDTDSITARIMTEDFIETLLVMLKDGLLHLTMMKMIKHLFQ